MSELCRDLQLSIYRDDSQVRIVLVDELSMSEVTVCYEISRNEKPNRSQQYYVREAVVIAMRRVVSEAFSQGLISFDSPGEWKIMKSPATTTASVSDEFSL
jgi:hypothetical protein